MSVRCSRCGVESPDATRFCPNCGLPLEARGGDTVVEEPPAEEHGPVPVNVVRHEPRLVSALMALAKLVRESQLGAGAGVAVEALKVRSHTERELLRPRRRLRTLAADRDRLFRELGAAVYTGDKAAREKAETELAAVDEAVAEVEREMHLIITKAEERMHSAQLSVQPTEIETPEIPEPYPPPGETDPPQQPDIPEPYPPPGELDPPQQPEIPEPYPRRSPEE